MLIIILKYLKLLLRKLHWNNHLMSPLVFSWLLFLCSLVPYQIFPCCSVISWPKTLLSTPTFHPGICFKISFSSLHFFICVFILHLPSYSWLLMLHGLWVPTSCSRCLLWQISCHLNIPVSNPVKLETSSHTAEIPSHSKDQTCSRFRPIRDIKLKQMWLWQQWNHTAVTCKIKRSFIFSKPHWTTLLLPTVSLCSTFACCYMYLPRLQLNLLHPSKGVKPHPLWC